VPVAALATEAVQIGVRDVIARRPKNFKALQDVSTLRPNLNSAGPILASSRA
jgi:hypothetical protein